MLTTEPVTVRLVPVAQPEIMICIWIKQLNAKSCQQYIPKLYFRIQYLNKKQYMYVFYVELFDPDESCHKVENTT